jgi:hypothetical protein
MRSNISSLPLLSKAFKARLIAMGKKDGEKGMMRESARLLRVSRATLPQPVRGSGLYRVSFNPINII